MKFVCATVYDTKAKAYMPPFFVGNRAVAIRAFADIANSEAGHQIAKNPGDYMLFIVGTFDDETGQISMYGEPDNCGLASQYLKDNFSRVTKILDREMN